MAHFAQLTRGRFRLSGHGQVDSFSNLALLMSLESQSILMKRPKKINLQNRAYEPSHLHIEFVDVTTPGSSQASISSHDLFPPCSAKTRETLSISSVS